mgnify:CR=1 FL=1
MKDIVDLSSQVTSLSIKDLQDLNVKHVRLIGSNTNVELDLGSGVNLAGLNIDDSTDDLATTAVDESAADDGLFAANYTLS